MNNKFCVNCGAPLDDGKYCFNCGNSISGINNYVPHENVKITNKKNMYTAPMSLRVILAVISLLSIIFLFCDWFIISLGDVGSLLEYFLGMDAGNLTRRYNVFTLLIDMVKVSEFIGENEILTYGMIYASILFLFGVIIFVDAILSIIFAFVGKGIKGFSTVLSGTIFFETCMVILGVYGVKLFITEKMEQSGFDALSPVVSNVLNTTTIPIIMFAIGIIIIVINVCIKSMTKHHKKEMITLYYS